MISDKAFEYFFERFPAGIYILNKERQYIYANETYLRLLGMKKEDLLMHDVQEFRKNGKFDGCISDYVFSEKQKVSVFINILSDNGSVIKKKQQLVRAIPLFDEKNEIIYMMGICEPVEGINESLFEADNRTLMSQDVNFSQPVMEENMDSHMVAVSQTMRDVLDDAKNIAKVNSTVLISGDTGTGKELMAEFIHRNSSRNDKRMVVVNCASLPPNLLESTLYGYEKGAFTGALSSGKTGLIEASDGGVLFLDEINSLPFELQGKLLRTLETKKIQRVGLWRR